MQIFNPQLAKLPFLQKLIHFPLSYCLACCILVTHPLASTNDAGEGWETQRPNHLPKVIKVLMKELELRRVLFNSDVHVPNLPEGFLLKARGLQEPVLSPKTDLPSRFINSPGQLTIPHRSGCFCYLCIRNREI